MPFFPELKKNSQNQKDVTLQVRIYPGTRLCWGKRVLSSASKSCRGSLSIEAALGLSIFIFAVVCLMIPMKMMDTGRQVQSILESIGEEIGQYAYIQYQLEHGNEEAVQGENWKSEFAKYFMGAVTESYAAIRIEEQVGNDAVVQISMWNSNILGDGETIDLVCDYQIKLPFPVLRLNSVPQTARCVRRAWIGKDGGRGGVGEGAEAEKETVYVGKESTRYHKNRSCHYLSNEMTTVNYGDLKELRNSSGGKYHPCQACIRGVGSGPVYIMSSGNSYHSSRNCSAIIAYVKAVSLSTVEHLGPCSYCSQ